MTVKEIWKRLRPQGSPQFNLRNLEATYNGIATIELVAVDQGEFRQATGAEGREDMAKRCEAAIADVKHSELWRTWLNRRKILRDAKDEYTGLQERLAAITEDQIRTELAAMVDAGKFTEATPSEITRAALTETRRLVEGRIALLTKIEADARQELEEAIRERVSAIVAENMRRCQERITELERELCEAVAPVLSLLLRVHAERQHGWDGTLAAFPQIALDRAAREADAQN